MTAPSTPSLPPPKLWLHPVITHLHPIITTLLRITLPMHDARDRNGNKHFQPFEKKGHQILRYAMNSGTSE